MTDARRRELARGGDLESEARALVEAVRAGELTQGDLDLAADLGDPRAGLATGRAQAPLARLCADLAAGPRRLPAACALGELAFPAWCWPRPAEPTVGEWVGQGIVALRAARDRGTPVDRERARNAHDASTQRDSLLVELGALAARVVALACEAAGERPASLARAARLGAGLLGEGDVRSALAGALLAPWLRPPAPATPPGWRPEADQLRRRLEIGSCDRVALELAAWNGHEAAGQALGLAPRPPLELPTRWEALIAALDPEAPRTRELAVRALLGCVRHGVSFRPGTPASDALGALVAWCLAPDADRAERALEAVPGAFEGAVVPSLQVAGGLFAGTSVRPFELLPLAARACGATPREARDLLAEGWTHDPLGLADALDRDVVPWLLGYRDPLDGRG